MSSKHLASAAAKPSSEDVGVKRSRPAHAGGAAAIGARNSAAEPTNRAAKGPKAKKAPAADAGYESSGTESDDIDEDELDLARPHAAGESDEDSGSDSDGSDGGDEIKVEFEFFDPRELDFKSVRRLLEHYLPGEETTFEVSKMADAIVAQEFLGTMIKVEDDPDVYAFATVLPMSKYRVSWRLICRNQRTSARLFADQPMKGAPVLAMRARVFAASALSSLLLSLLRSLALACFCRTRRG